MFKIIDGDEIECFDDLKQAKLVALHMFRGSYTMDMNRQDFADELKRNGYILIEEVAE